MSNGVDFKKISLENRELLNSALAREDALREELDTVRDLHAKQCCVFCNDTGNLRSVHAALQQRLTVSERRVDLLEGLLKSGSSPTYAHCSAVMEALKPAAEPEHICEGCGSKGWTANCDKCVPY